MEFEKDVIRKVTFKLIPALVVLYLVAYIDRAAVGFAHLHMGADVGIGDAAYGLGAGLFFIGYFLFEVPSNLLLDKFGARKWFARILLTWGLITMAMALIQGPYSFYILRFLLGVAEAGFFPGVLYLITQWYPVRHRGKIMGMFILSQPIAMMVAGPLAGALLGMDGIANMHGWQWLFIVVGLPAVLLAWPTLLYLPEKINSVKWLSNEQKTWLSNELIKDEAEYDQTRHGNPLHALKDKRVLTLALYYLPVTLSIYGLNLWLPTIIKQFSGGSDLQVGFLSSIPYVFGIIGLLIIPRSTDKLNDRYGHLSFLYALGACGMFFSAWLTSPVMQLIALSVVAFCLFSTTAVFWTLPGRFLTGASAAAGIALINSVGNLGGYIGPFGIGLLKQYTGNMASGLYFLTIVMIFGLILTYFVYAKFETQKSKTMNISENAKG
ncbi:MFS transporter [Acinetobacter lwoffii]|jgi:MFS family permease|uniref:MFS transporter n=1 Tax=Acinetobacter lwoffii TaxID=28090 RepID=UPI001C5B8E60|nr:MFS transporter [Acinetobacter lwoffii]MBU3846068.1 MFS transporter [Candidatus Acinetobacter avistercoris]MCO8083578.1 MFS transporter [Acinetobacter lwoffii]MCO8098256.1 MFS transporter [Acinetobacter lwoffii]QXX87736.1 MFS transporter [Acinetobacter lwoffii]